MTWPHMLSFVYQGLLPQVLVFCFIGSCCHFLTPTDPDSTARCPATRAICRRSCSLAHPWTPHTFKRKVPGTA